MESGKTIGEVFKEKLYDYSEEPGNQVWENIQSNPDLIKFNKHAGFNPFKYIIGTAAIVTVTTLAILAFNYYSEDNIIDKVVNHKVVAPQNNSQINPSDLNTEKNTFENNGQIPSQKHDNSYTNAIEEKNSKTVNPIKNNTLNEVSDIKIITKNDFFVENHVETNEVKTPTNTNVYNHSDNNIKNTKENTPTRTVKNVIPIVASHDTIICRWSGINLSVSGATAVIWSNGSNANQIYVEPSESAVFSARVTNSEGNDTTIKVFVQVVDCFQIYMPTAFTPDGDGLNDEFKAVYNGNISDFEMMIFTRSGKKVFESKDINLGWDGKINGSQIEEGAYFYVIRYKDAMDKVKEQTGQVILYRSR